MANVSHFYTFDFRWLSKFFHNNRIEKSEFTVKQWNIVRITIDTMDNIKALQQTPMFEDNEIIEHFNICR